MNQTAVQNPMDVLDTPYTPPPFEVFGQVQMNVFFAALVKGVGKVPFEEGNPMHKSRVTAIEMNIVPLAESNSEVVTRSMIRESKEWSLVAGSFATCGMPKASDLNGRWVRVQFEPTGDTYVNGQGETKNKTYLKFMEVYANEAACKAAYLSAHANGGNGQAASQGVAAPAANPAREAALKFLAVIVENACRGQSDSNVIHNTIALNLANMPQVAQFFTVDSPETQALIAEKSLPF